MKIDNMKILAIDPGTKELGWARAESGVILSWGTLYFTGERPARFAQAYRALLKILDVDPASLIDSELYDLVCYERPFVRGRDATRCGWGLGGIIEALATDCGAAVIDVENNRWKKAIVGRGNATKDDIIAELTTRGFHVKTEHEADVLGILIYAMERIEVRE